MNLYSNLYCNPKVLVIVYVKNVQDIIAGCLEAINAQDYRNFDLLIHQMWPIEFTDDPFKNKTENVTRNRNAVRKLILASGAEWIMWVDSDTIIPVYAISEFLKVVDINHQLLGGWYPKYSGEKWVTGRWCAPNVMEHFTRPVAGVVPVDFIGIGCSMMHRSVLECLEFRSAVDECVSGKEGEMYYKGNCVSFCEDAAKFGILSYMVGSIICQHKEK